MSPGIHGVAWVEHAALMVLLTLIPLRALLGEQYTFESPALMRGIDAPPDAGPATTFSIILVTIVTALALAVIRLWKGDRRYRWTGAEPGAILLLIAAVISFTRAGQKHLALIGACDFLGVVLYFLTLRQLLLRPWQVRLALAVILGTGAMLAAKAAYQHWIEFPDTQAYFDQYHREQLAETTGHVAPGLLHDFEMRMQSRAATGYFAHANVFATYLVVIILIGLGVALARFRRRPSWTLIAPAVIATACAASLVFTQSKGAVAAGGIAAIAGLAAHRWRDALARRPKRVLAAFWLATALGTGAFIGLLHAKPDALGRSMLFRTLYWRGASDMLKATGPWGVGPENFGRWFTRFKPVECPEDVQSPHSWVVQSASEWGVLGLIALCVLFVGVTINWARPSPVSCPDSQPGGRIAVWGFGIALLTLAAWMPILAGADPYYLLMTLVLAVPVWIVGYIFASIIHAGRSRFADDTLGPIFAMLCAAALAFVLHSAVDLAMFWPGAPTLFFAVLSIACAVRSGRDAEANRPLAKTNGRIRAAVVVGLVGAAAATAFLVMIVIPAARTNALLESARQSLNSGRDDRRAAGSREYESAVAAYRLDGTADAEWAQSLATVVTPDAASLPITDRILGLLDELRVRDPQNAVLESLLATVRYQRYMITRDLHELDAAVSAQRAATQRSPGSPIKRLYLAQILESYWEKTGSTRAREDAIQSYQETIDLDRRRTLVSEPNHLSPQMLAQIESAIRNLQTATTTAPSGD